MKSTSGLDKRMTRAQRNRLILLKPKDPTATIFASQAYPGGIKALPKDIPLRITKHFLDPVDAVSLGLTCHFFHSLVTWAWQKPLCLICPPTLIPAQVHNRNIPPWFNRGETISLPSEEAVQRAKLFRGYLRDFMGAEQIYCGMPGRPATRSLMRASAFLKDIDQHIYCGCFCSLVQRDKHIMMEVFEDMSKTKRNHCLSVIGLAQQRIVKERERLRSRLLGPY